MHMPGSPKQSQSGYGIEPSHRQVTISDVAALAGVSRATVSYAFSQPSRLSKEMLAKVRESVEALGYVGNDAARQLRVGHSRALGLLVSDASNPIFAELASGAEAEASLHDRFVLVANSNESLEREREYVGFFESQRVGGILIAPVDDVPSELVALGERGTPFVLVGAPEGHRDYPWISGDNTLGGRLAAQHLLDQGRTRLLLAGGPHHHVRSRFAGASSVVQDARGVSLETITVPQQTAANGEQIAQQLLSRPTLPDGIFAGNDLLALGILHGLLAGGVRVPQDVSLVGYDDIEFADFAVVPLTTIRHPSASLGASAVRLLIGLEAQDISQFEPRLVIRKTSLVMG